MGVFHRAHTHGLFPLFMETLSYLSFEARLSRFN